MTLSDWIIDIALIVAVVRQVRETTLRPLFVLLPVGLVTYVATQYLHSVPTAGNDLWLVVLLGVVGALLGIGGTLTTRVRVANGKVLVRAGVVSAVLWVLGMGARLGFSLWTEHGGGPALVRFSAAHHITSVDAWIAAIIIMALAEVLVRIGTIVVRTELAARSAGVAGLTSWIPSQTLAA